MKFLFNALIWIVAKIVGKCSKCTPLLLLCLLFGCTSSTSYSEGQNLNLGIIAPYDGQIYGANVVSFFSGCRVQAVSNQTFAISRIASSSNTYLWGAAQTNERTDTSVVFENQETK